MSSRSGDDGSNPRESKVIVLIVFLLVQAKELQIEGEVDT